MGRPSKIDKLPKEIQGAVADLRAQGHSIDQILDHLKTLGGPAAEVSRSGLGRHVKELDQITEILRRSRGVAEGLAERLGEDDGGGKALRLNTELLHSAATRLMLASMEGDDLKLDAKEVAFLASAMSKLSAATKGDVEREIRVRHQLLAKAADDAGTVAHEAGLSSETVDMIKRRILGLGAA